MASRPRPAVASEGDVPELIDLGSVAWLQSLASMGFGALLADDMGLGKTLQAICLLASGTESGPHLVVCPTSVVGNWERELSRSHRTRRWCGTMARTASPCSGSCCAG
jgi:SNF2 family DNA or RNA helicase